MLVSCWRGAGQLERTFGGTAAAQPFTPADQVRDVTPRGYLPAPPPEPGSAHSAYWVADQPHGGDPVSVLWDGGKDVVVCCRH